MGAVGLVGRVGGELHLGEAVGVKRAKGRQSRAQRSRLVPIEGELRSPLGRDLLDRLKGPTLRNFIVKMTVSSIHLSGELHEEAIGDFCSDVCFGARFRPVTATNQFGHHQSSTKWPGLVLGSRSKANNRVEAPKSVGRSRGYCQLTGAGKIL